MPRHDARVARVSHRLSAGFSHDGPILVVANRLPFRSVLSKIGPSSTRTLQRNAIQCPIQFVSNGENYCAGKPGPPAAPPPHSLEYNLFVNPASDRKISILPGLEK